MTPIQRITEIENEIFDAAHCEGKLRSKHRRMKDSPEKKIVEAQIKLIGQRIERAKLEMKAIENVHFAEIHRAWRDAKYPPVPAVRPIRIEMELV